MRAIWHKGYQRGSLGKSHQNGDYLKLLKLRRLLIPAGKQLFRIACFEVVAVLVTLPQASALVAFRTDSTQTINNKFCDVAKLFNLIIFCAPKTKSTSQARDKHEIFASFRPEPEPDSKIPDRVTTLPEIP